MLPESLQFLKSLVNTPSPTGHEARGLKLWRDYVQPFAGETFSDAYGNTVAVLNKGGGPRVMLAAHADEIAMTVNFITPEGFVHVRRTGGVDPAITKAQRVTIHSQGGPIKGVVGNVAIHLTKADTDPKPPKIHELFIDIGVASKRDALKLLRIGDPVTLSDEFEFLRDDLAVARAFDNRAGTWAVAEALRILKAGEKKLDCEVCAVANIQEEVGLFGARQIAYSLKPDIAIVVDVTHATDCPTIDQRQHGEIKLGGGPTLTRGGPNHHEVVTRLEQVAARKRIALQYEAMSNSSGTDTDVIFWTRGGIPSALVSLPLRYMHSPVEVVSLKDLEVIPELLAGFAQSIHKGEEFRIKI
ncbi:MAG: M42 family peptidase [Pedosphaera sp.]|nr:M42 family peptidase [Pedosphaera sp.]